MQDLTNSISSLNIKPSKNAMKRIMSDLKDFEKEPIEGISISFLESNMFELHANILLTEGQYSGAILHFVLSIPPTYPLSSPAGSMGPNYPLSDNAFDHIHNGGLCNDYLSNFETFFRSIDRGKIIAGSGWNPAITIKGLLNVLKFFFIDNQKKKNSSEVATLLEKLETYECNRCGHTNKNPFPPLLTKVTEEDVKLEPPIIDDPITILAREKLVCSITREDMITNPNMILGYPILLKVDKFNRLHMELTPELISYQHYAQEIQNVGIIKLDRFLSVLFKTSTSNPYNCWLAIYVNEDHFQKNLDHIKNTISVIATGIQGTEENAFVPEMSLKVLLPLMNKMVVSLTNGKLHESENAILAYSHYLRLLMRFLDEYPQCMDIINGNITNFINEPNMRSKQYVPDIGEFLIQIALSNKYSFEDEELKTILLEEYFARQVFWINKNDSSVYKMKPSTTFLKKVFNASQVSNKLLVFNIYMAKTFIFDGVKQILDKNYSMPPNHIITRFQEIIKNIKVLDNYKGLMEALTYGNVIINDKEMYNFLIRAKELSKSRGYTNF